MTRTLIILTALALTACATGPVDITDHGWKAVRSEPYKKAPNCTLTHHLNDEFPNVVMTKMDCGTKAQPDTARQNPQPE